MKKIKNIKLFSMLLAACMLFTACTQAEQLLAEQNKTDYNNTVTMLDVGQASCNLIESEGQFCLIDMGKSGGSTDVVSYLANRGVEKIDLLVITHFHHDHTSEVLDVVRNFDIGTVLIPSLSQDNIPDTYLYKSLLEDAKNGYYSLEYAYKGWEYQLGDGVLKVLADTYNGENINNTSIVTSYTLSDFVYVNTGDTEKDKETEILDLLPENIDFLTAGHHGSQDATSEALLLKLKPAFAGISCGEDNDYGHPHKNMVTRLENMGIEYAITYECGNIVYSMCTYQVKFE